MKKQKTWSIWTGLGLLLAFAGWTALIQLVDVQAAGPKGTRVGLASFNLWFHRRTGVHMLLYTITDWLGLVPIAVCLCFGAVGAAQLIRRRSLLRVDSDILLLGLYYLLVIFGYLLFEMVPINYRPILIGGVPEASYPSSTALLTASVMPTLALQIRRRCSRPGVKTAANLFAISFSACMVIGRLISGVHWATDIVGAVLLSAGLFFLYRYSVAAADRRREKSHGVQ